MPEPLLSDEELFRRIRAKPEVQQAIKDTLARVARIEAGEEEAGPGITLEELRAVLAEYERRHDSE